MDEDFTVLDYLAMMDRAPKRDEMNLAWTLQQLGEQSGRESEHA